MLVMIRNDTCAHCLRQELARDRNNDLGCPFPASVPDLVSSTSVPTSGTDKILSRLAKKHKMAQARWSLFE